MTNDMIPEDMVELIAGLRREVLFQDGAIESYTTNEEISALCKESWVIEGHKDDLRWKAADTLQALTTGDYVLVPVEPTEEMLKVSISPLPVLRLGSGESGRVQEWRHVIYKAMLAARPKTKE